MIEHTPILDKETAQAILEGEFRYILGLSKSSKPPQDIGKTALATTINAVLEATPHLTPPEIEQTFGRVIMPNIEPPPPSPETQSEPSPSASEDQKEQDKEDATAKLKGKLQYVLDLSSPSNPLDLRKKALGATVYAILEAVPYLTPEEIHQIHEQVLSQPLPSEIRRSGREGWVPLAMVTSSQGEPTEIILTPNGAIYQVTGEAGTSSYRLQQTGEEPLNLDQVWTLIKEETDRSDGSTVRTWQTPILDPKTQQPVKIKQTVHPLPSASDWPRGVPVPSRPITTFALTKPEEN